MRDEFNISGFMIGILVMLALIGFYAASAFESVGVGEVAFTVDSNSGTFGTPIVGPKWFFKTPIFHYTVRVPISTQYLVFSDSDPARDFDGLMCFTKEGIEVEIDMIVRYSVDSSKAADLYRQYPNMNWERSTLGSVANEKAKEITKEYSWTEIRDKRGEVATKIQDALMAAFTAEPSLSRAIEDAETDIKNIALPDKLVIELQSTVVAQQAVITAENNRKAALVEADAKAQAALISAEGEAKAQVARADGEAKAIQKIIDIVGVDGWDTYYAMQKLKEIAPQIDTFILSGNDLSTIIPIK